MENENVNHRRRRLWRGKRGKNCKYSDQTVYQENNNVKLNRLNRDYRLDHPFVYVGGKKLDLLAVDTQDLLTVWRLFLAWPHTDHSYMGSIAC